ncbi:MAG: hypothetical protein ABEJ83_05805 [Candidatus Nanohaloarchaea archaeon]
MNYKIPVKDIDFSKMKFERKVDIESIQQHGEVPFDELVKIAGAKNIYQDTAREAETEFNRSNCEQLTEEAFQILAECGTSPALSYLTLLDGVRARTASAILAAYNPNKYGIIDERAVNYLKRQGFFPETDSVGSWRDREYIRNFDRYLEILGQIVEENPGIETVREADFALYQLGDLES